VRFFAVIILTLAFLVGIVAFGGISGNAVSAMTNTVNFEGRKTNDDRVAFIKEFGVDVKEAPIETVDFTLPENFDRIIAGYNEIQKMQGLDLSKYKNKKVTRYTYLAENYDGYDGDVYVNLILYKNTVIACDISSADPSGFISPLIRYK
jgi:hypothetical protein